MKDIDSQWKRIKQLAGVNNARLHDLRRTITTDYARLGASTYQIQTALGQKTDIAAKHYVHLAAAEVTRELMERRAKSRNSSNEFQFTQSVAELSLRPRAPGWLSGFY